jgi:ribonuclease R
MKDKIIEILTNSNKSISASEIMNIIKNNYVTEDLKLLLNDLNELFIDGIIYQNKDGNYLLFDKCHLLKGYIEINSSGSGFLLQDTEDVYIPYKYLNNSNDGDFVIVELLKSKGVKREGKVIRILKRSLGSSLAEVYLSNGKI